MTPDTGTGLHRLAHMPKVHSHFRLYYLDIALESYFSLHSQL